MNNEAILRTPPVGGGFVRHVRPRTPVTMVLLDFQRFAAPYKLARIIAPTMRFLLRFLAQHRPWTMFESVAKHLRFEWKKIKNGDLTRSCKYFSPKLMEKIDTRFVEIWNNNLKRNILFKQFFLIDTVIRKRFPLICNFFSRNGNFVSFYRDDEKLQRHCVYAHIVA